MVFKKPIINELLYSLHLITHPIDGFWDLKHEKRGSVRAVNVIIILTYITNIIRRQLTGFLFTSPGENVLYLNFFQQAMNLILPIMLWIIANWALTTLMDGEGTFKDIYIATGYAVTPILLMNIPLTIMSNLLTNETMEFYSIVNGITLVLVGMLIFLGTMITHQYTMGKTVISCIGIIVGMCVIIFVSLMFFNLIQQVMGFAVSVYKELTLTT